MYETCRQDNITSTSMQTYAEMETSTSMQTYAEMETFESNIVNENEIQVV